MKSYRLFKILIILLEKKFITATALAKTLEVSVRTIYRDIDELSALGIPLYTTFGKNGGVHLSEDYIFDKAVLSLQEKKELLSTLDALNSVPNLIVTDLFKKFSILYDQPSKQPFESSDASKENSWFEVDFSTWQKIDDAQSVLFHQLKKSIITHFAVRIKYINTKSETTIRTVDPHKLVYKYKDWFLYGYCKLKCDFRLFKLDRIIQCEILEQKIDQYENIPRPYEDNYINSRSLAHVELIFTMHVAYKVYEHFNRQLISQLDDKHLLVSGDLEIEEWLLTMLASFGPNVYVKSPETLRMRLISIHKASIDFLQN